MPKMGPFSESHLDQILQELDALKVTYQVIKNTERHRDFISEANLGRTKPFRLIPVYYDIDISDSDFKSLGNKFEKYGVVQPSDGQELLGEDYICPSCKGLQNSQG